MARLPNTYLDLGGVPHALRERYPCPQAAHVIEKAAAMVGVEKFLWGSDYPRTLTDLTYQQQVEVVSLGCRNLSELDREQIPVLNAERLLGAIPWGMRPQPRGVFAAKEKLMEGKKILITGASGQCGRGMALVLSKKNDVHALARFSRPGAKEQVESFGCTAWQVDMGTAVPDMLPNDFDVVFHQAVSWHGDDDLSIQNQSFHLACQFVGDLMYLNDKATFVLMSTGSVYTHSVDLCKEDETPVEGGHTYVTEKICMTQVARWIGRTFQRPWAVLRYWRPFAPYVPHGKVDAILEGKMPGKNPVALPQRTYVKIHIDNTIKAAEYACPEGEIFNSATTEMLTAADVARAGAKVGGVEVDPRVSEPAEPIKPGHAADTSKIERMLGPASISFEEGLRRYQRARQENITVPQDWMFEEEEK